MNREAAGAAIRSLRRSRDISQEDLAEMAGMSAMGLSFLERGMRKPRKETIKNLELALGLPPGTYQRLVLAEDAEAELRSILSTATAAAAQANAAVSQGLVVGRRSANTTALLGSYAEAQIDALRAVISRMPDETASDFETYISLVLDRCLQAEGLTADSWRVSAAADAADADRLATHLATLESTRRELTARLACAVIASGLPDVLVAQQLETSAETLWDWRNLQPIPSESIAPVRRFIAFHDPTASADEQ